MTMDNDNIDNDENYVQGIVEEERTEWEFGNKEKIKTLQKGKKTTKKDEKGTEIR